MPGAKTYLSFLILSLSCLSPLTGSLSASKTKSDREKKSQILAMSAKIHKKFSVPKINAETLMAWKKDQKKKILLVDVRSEKERKVSTIAGAISQVEFERLGSSLAEQNIVCYCTIGYRSGKYCEELKKKGLNAYNLEGSVLSWAHAGGDFYEPSGARTNRVHVYAPNWDLLPEAYQSVY